MDPITIEYLTALVLSKLDRRGFDVYDDRGAIATEMSVAIGIIIGVLVIAGLIWAQKVRSNANSIPDTVQPPT